MARKKKSKEDHIKDMILDIFSTYSSDDYIQFEQALTHDFTKCNDDCLVSGRCMYEESVKTLNTLCNVAKKHVDKINKT